MSTSLEYTARPALQGRVFCVWGRALTLAWNEQGPLGGVLGKSCLGSATTEKHVIPGSVRNDTASIAGKLGTQENSNKYLPLGCMKQTMKCFTAVARREGAQVRKGRVGIAGLLKATGRGLASIH